MYCYNSCCVCLGQNINIKIISLQDTDGVLIEEKLKYILSEFDSFNPNITTNICTDCLKDVNYVYKFKRKFLANLIELSDKYEKHVVKTESTQPGYNEYKIPEYNTEFKDETLKTENIEEIVNEVTIEEAELKNEYKQLHHEVFIKEEPLYLDETQTDLKDALEDDQNESRNITDEDLQASSPELRGVTASELDNILSIKSKGVYEKEYEKFMNWCTEKNIQIITENALITFFEIMSKSYKSSTLWKTYSMLRTMLNVRQNLNISNYLKLQSLLKGYSTGYQPKKSRIFQYDEIERFIHQAPDIQYLSIKAVLIMGYSGACTRDELINLLTDDIEYKPNAIFVTISKSKMARPRLFTITNEVWINLIKRYAGMRPPSVTHKRFFIFYGRGRCTMQPIGLNKMGEIPRIIARYLNLEFPEQYSGHCFRRSSVSHLASNGGELITIKRHGGWKLKSKAERYVDATTKRTVKVSEILSTISTSSRALINS